MENIINKNNLKDHYETPFFIFNKNQFENLFDHFSRYGTIFYPVKTNDNIYLLREIASLGSSFETDGIYHIERLLSIGVSPEKIQFSIPIKKQNDIEKALKCGVNRFVVDTKEEYVRISKNSKDIQFIIRISINDILHIPEINYYKWGMPLHEAIDLAKIIENGGNSFLGISFYLPKDIFNSENFEKVLNHIGRNVPADYIKVLDVGGGLDNSFSPKFHNQIKNIKKSLNIESIILEPGRNLIDPCMDMIVSVIGVANRGNRMWAYIDTGIYSGLIDHVIKDRVFEILSFNSLESSLPKKFEYIISGPTSDTIDILGEYSFKVPLKVGDRLVIKNSGAYTSILTTNFCEIKHFGFSVD